MTTLAVSCRLSSIGIAATAAAAAAAAGSCTISRFEAAAAASAAAAACVGEGGLLPRHLKASAAGALLRALSRASENA